MAGCDWCISILPFGFVVPASSCSLSDPLLIPVDVLRLKSYVDSFLSPMCVIVRVSINKLDLVPNWTVAGLVGVLRHGGGLGMSES